jgi:hypothetical protein
VRHSPLCKVQQSQVADLKRVLQGFKVPSQSQVQSAINAEGAVGTTLNQKFDAMGLTTGGSGTGSSS